MKTNPEHYETAIRVLESIRDEETEKDELWNHRMGFALYHLDREGKLPNTLFAHLRVSLMSRLLPTRKSCLPIAISSLPFPRYTPKVSFADRVKKTWEAFEEHEAELRQLVDNGASGDEIQQLLSLV